MLRPYGNNIIIIINIIVIIVMDDADNTMHVVWHDDECVHFDMFEMDG